MSSISRREFFTKSAAGAAAVTLLASHVDARTMSPLGLPIGSQTYPHRARLVSGGFPALLKDMKAIGIEVVELCNPTYPEFASLADGNAARRILDDHGMKALSAHFQMDALRTEQQKQIDWALALGMTQMSTASLNGRIVNGVTTEDEVKRAASEYNTIAEVAKRNGLQQVLHTGVFEYSRLGDGRITCRVLMQYLDPDLVKMQFQMSHVPRIGSPIPYFNDFPGRFASLHLQGVPPTASASGNDTGLAVGEDATDWRAVFDAAKIGGVRNYFVEQPWDLTVRSVAYLKTFS